MIESLSEYEALISEYKNLRKVNPISFIDFYPWQKEVFKQTKTNNQVAAIAANQVGKTRSFGAMTSYFLTGEYPPWWKGRVFNHPTKVLVCGVSGDQIKDVIQSLLIGEIDLEDKTFKGGGLIRKELLGGFEFIVGNKNLLKEIRIKHKSGGWSVLRFRSYEQGPRVLMGEIYDFILIDEEPEDGITFYAQCLVRTAMGNKGKGGLVGLSFTPENGVTPLVDMLLNETKDGQFVITVGWDQAPHLDKKTREQLEAAIPVHLRSAKTKGIPTFGDGSVFDVTDDEILCEPFEIPDYYFIICGIDFGLRHPFGCVFCAHDRDTDVIYVFHSWEIANKTPADHTYRINSTLSKVPISYPHDGHNREKGSGIILKKYYEDAGANMKRMFSNRPEPGREDKIDSRVEPGIMELNTRMKDGRLKIFSNQLDFMRQFRKYHRKNGIIVPKNDNIMSAFRYAVCMVERFGERKSDIGKPKFLLTKKRIDI